MASSDPFDDIINLEEAFYADGHKEGVADGARAGRAEGRALGTEKGYEKFIEAGRLYGKAIVWANRLAPPPPPPKEQQQQQQLPTLSGAGAGARLEKNVVMLYALVEPETLSTENSDEAVNDVDDRVKRAQGKARVVERQVGEDGPKKEGAKRAVEGGSGDKAASPSATPPATGTGLGF